MVFSYIIPNLPEKLRPRDMRRLFSFSHRIGRLGDLLYHGTRRRAVAIAVLSAGWIYSGTSRFWTLLLGTVGATGALLAASFLLGAALRAISRSLSQRSSVLAEGTGANLTENMKITLRQRHRDELWRRVMRHEQIRYSPQDIAGEEREVADHLESLVRLIHPSAECYVGPPPDKERLADILKRAGKSELGWKLSFDEALNDHQAQSVEQMNTGLDLRMMEDWYDGGLFHRSDTRLWAQFRADPRLRAVRRQVGRRARGSRRVGRLGLDQHVWFEWIMSAFEWRSLVAGSRLNELCPDFPFTLEHFVWPSDALDRAVREQLAALLPPPGVEQCILALHEQQGWLFSTALHPDYDDAIRKLDKAILPDFLSATALRRAYDPQYVLGELGYSWESDLAEWCPQRGDSERIANQVARTRQMQVALAAFLDERFPEMKSADRAEARRAVRIAAHTNRDGLGKVLLRGKAGDAERIVRLVLDETRTYTANLLAVRVHHQLAVFELGAYRHYVSRILKPHPTDAGSTSGERPLQG